MYVFSVSLSTLIAPRTISLLTSCYFFKKKAVERMKSICKNLDESRNESVDEKRRGGVCSFLLFSTIYIHIHLDLGAFVLFPFWTFIYTYTLVRLSFFLFGHIYIHIHLHMRVHCI